MLAHPLRTLVECEGDGGAGRGHGLCQQAVHGEAGQSPCQLKHVELGAGGGAALSHETIMFNSVVIARDNKEATRPDI